MKRIRKKTYLTILPVVVATVVISGYLSFLESRTALTKLANQHLAYKAEQLRDYINNEWDVVEALGLSDQGAYRAAQEESFRSYSYSLLRSDSEQVLVFDSSGTLVSRTGGLGATVILNADMKADEPVLLQVGWFSRKIAGEERVGIAFNFEPFGWTVAVSDLRSHFFSDVNEILRTNLYILLIAILIAAVLITINLGYTIGPLERLTETIERISATGDLSYRTKVEYPDEIGMLAHRFNALIGTLETRNAQLNEVNKAERAIRETAIQREGETLLLLGRISDYNDHDTGAHLSRIGSISSLFSQLLGQSDEDQELIFKSAPLHDIGKIAIPNTILLKPGKLTEEEFETIKRHAILGFELLNGCQSKFLSEGARIAYTHHERWDGKGYPRGVAGEEIPLSGRIVSIVDVFDALTSKRPYKDAWSREKALEYIVEQRGKQFDPLLVDVFHDHFAEFKEVWTG